MGNLICGAGSPNKTAGLDKFQYHICVPRFLWRTVEFSNFFSSSLIHCYNIWKTQQFSFQITFHRLPWIQRSTKIFWWILFQNLGEELWLLYSRYSLSVTPSLTGFYFRRPEGPALVYMKRSLFKAPDPITTVETKQSKILNLVLQTSIQD